VKCLQTQSLFVYSLYAPGVAFSLFSHAIQPSTTYPTPTEHCITHPYCVRVSASEEVMSFDRSEDVSQEASGCAEGDDVHGAKVETVVAVPVMWLPSCGGEGMVCCWCRSITVRGWKWLIV